MFVDDLVEALLRVGLDPSSDGEVFNIGNPHEVTMRELAAEIGRAIGRDSGLNTSRAAPATRSGDGRTSRR